MSVVRYLLLWSAQLCFASVFAGSLHHIPMQQNIFGYIGQPSGKNPSLVALGGYRLYDARAGHFLKQDSYSPFIGKRTLNGFNYAVGNPIFLVDASGHSPDAPVANGVSMPVVPPDGQGVVASGSPGVWSNAAAGESFMSGQSISMPDVSWSPQAALVESIEFYKELWVTKTRLCAFRAETLARGQVIDAALREGSIIGSPEKVSQQLELLGQEMRELGEWERMISEQDKVLGAQYSRIAKLYRAAHESIRGVP